MKVENTQVYSCFQTITKFNLTLERFFIFLYYLIMVKQLKTKKSSILGLAGDRVATKSLEGTLDSVYGVVASIEVPYEEQRKVIREERASKHLSKY